MPVPLQVTYRDVDQSEALDALVSTEAEKLERYFGGILSCRVVIEHSHERRHRGSPFQARITLSLPGNDVVVNQGPDVHDSIASGDDETARVQKRTNVDAAFKDPALAVRDAFKRARRRLQDHVRLQGEPQFRY